MNKKLFLGALLVGAIALNSCVDDKESASVTNVREAKAEQLKAVGEAAKTKAEAEKIAAEANAKVQEAQAKLIAAQEAAQVAQTQIDKEKAAAEIQRLQEQLASEIAVANANIEKIKAEAEKYNMEAQNQFLTNQNTQIDNLTTLLTSYSTATADLVVYQRDLVVAQNDLAAWEAGLVSWEDARLGLIASKQEEINKTTQKITDNDAQLATLEQYYGNVAAAQEQLTKAQAETEELRNKYSAAKIDEQMAASDAESAAEKLAKSRYLQVVRDSVAYGWPWWDLYAEGKVTGSISISSYSNWLQGSVYAYTYYFELNRSNSSSNEYLYLGSDGMKYERIKYTYEDGQRQQTKGYYEYPDTFLVMTEAIYKDTKAALDQYVKDVQEANVTAAQKQYDDYVAVVKAKDAWDAAIAEGSTATPDQVAAAEKTFKDAREEYGATYGWYYNEIYSTKELVDEEKDKVTTALANAQDALARANAAVAQFASRYKSVAAEQATYQAYIAPLNTNSKAYAEAQVARDKAYQAYNENINEITTLKSIVNAGGIPVNQYDEAGNWIGTKTVSVVEAMASLKSTQTTLNGKLADLQEELAALDTDDAEKEYEEDNEYWTQYYTKIVEDKQLIVDNQTKYVDALKAAIDQLSAETPAE